MAIEHGSSGEGNAIESAQSTLDFLWSGMLAADFKSKLHGDKYFMTRQDELFNRQMDRCHCQHNTCMGCLALVSMLERIAPKLHPESETTQGERQRARAEAIEDERKAKETLSSVQRHRDAQRGITRAMATVDRRKHYTEDEEKN